MPKARLVAVTIVSLLGASLPGCTPADGTVADTLAAFAADFFRQVLAAFLF